MYDFYLDFAGTPGVDFHWYLQHFGHVVLVPLGLAAL